MPPAPTFRKLLPPQSFVGIGVHWWLTRFDGLSLLESRVVAGSRHEPRLQVHVTEVTACWESELNQNYQLQFRSPRTPGGWVNVGSPVVGTGGTNCVADHIPLNEPQRFYRVTRVQ